MTHVLVAHGSRHGGTAEIATWIAEELRAAGALADVRAARSVREPNDHQAVVLGGALYAGRRHRGARRFAWRYARALRDPPVRPFGSGPLDRSAGREDIPPVPGVRRVAGRIGARRHVTFGGRLDEDVRGFPAAAMAERPAGDHRDRVRIRERARSIAAEPAPDRAGRVTPIVRKGE